VAVVLTGIVLSPNLSYTKKSKKYICPFLDKQPIISRNVRFDMVKTGEQPTEKILVTPATKQELTMLKQPGERYGDVVARLVREQKQQDYIAQILRVAEEGDFVRMDSDEEYVRIRDEVKQSAPRDRSARARVH